MESKYYDGTKLLSMLDLNGKKPEIYMVTTNRTGGKTTYFGRLAINRFLKNGTKFALLYRFNYELDDVADKFFKDLKGLFFSNYYMKSKKKGKGVYTELYISTDESGTDEKHCGYAIALNSADQIKKYSHIFSDVDLILFDEFQSETNHYCDNEITKFISIHTSIARGKGEQVRYVPVIMMSNQVSIINPYYIKLGISSRLNSNTNFLRGDGFILENGFIETASLSQKESGFNRAFKDDKYVEYSSENIYLNDNMAFVEKPIGKSRYLGTLRYNNTDYAIREYAEQGVLYCDDKPDLTYPHRLSVTTEDHNINYVMLKKNDVFIQNMRWFFERGCFRFKDLRCKEALMKAISY